MESDGFVRSIKTRQDTAYALRIFNCVKDILYEVYLFSQDTLKNCACLIRD